MMPVRVLIVDDDPLVRAGLGFMLGGAPEIELVGEASDGAEVPDAVRRLRPDVVLMDIRMATVDGLTATRELRTWTDAPEVIVLTTFDADQHVLEALRAGAAGFLLKDTAPADIVRGIAAVAAGDATLSPSVTRRLIGLVDHPHAVGRARAKSRLQTLSERELEVARGIGHGLSNAEIADTTYMALATVKAYVSRLLVKLGLTNRVQIALVVYEAELHQTSGGDQP